MCAKEKVKKRKRLLLFSCFECKTPFSKHKTLWKCCKCSWKAVELVSSSETSLKKISYRWKFTSKKKRRTNSKKGVGGDEKHVFSFTWLYPLEINMVLVNLLRGRVCFNTPTTLCSLHNMILLPIYLFRATEGSDFPPDATINASSFVTRNYILSTTTAQIALVIADGTKVKVSYSQRR